MSALYRLKAYFGMVPAEELDDYAFEPDGELSTGDYHGDYQGDYHGDYQDDYQDDREPGYERGHRGAAGNGHRPDRRPEHPTDRRPGRSRWDDEDGHRADGYDTDGYYGDDPEAGRAGRGGTRTWAAETPVRGALAVDASREAREVIQTREVREVAVRTRPAPAEEVHPLARRITTLHPHTYNEARTIGEHYREGTPVIMNLTEMTDADAKRLVDFAAGLAFALRGSIDKITTKVFLISPPNVDVTAEDRRRLAEGSFLNRSV